MMILIIRYNKNLRQVGSFSGSAFLFPRSILPSLAFGSIILYIREKNCITQFVRSPERGVFIFIKSLHPMLYSPRHE
jgi:hypothetical protein